MFNATVPNLADRPNARRLHCSDPFQKALNASTCKPKNADTSWDDDQTESYALLPRHDFFSLDAGALKFRFSALPEVAVKLNQRDSQSFDCDIFRSTHESMSPESWKTGKWKI